MKCVQWRTWHDGLLAGGALGGVLMGVALCAQQQIVFGSKGLLHQRALALGTGEALVVPVAVLIGQILGQRDDKVRVRQHLVKPVLS